jgi:hypothetical protein
MINVPIHISYTLIAVDVPAAQNSTEQPISDRPLYLIHSDDGCLTPGATIASIDILCLCLGYFARGKSITNHGLHHVESVVTTAFDIAR